MRPAVCFLIPRCQRVCGHVASPLTSYLLRLSAVGRERPGSTGLAHEWPMKKRKDGFELFDIWYRSPLNKGWWLFFFFPLWTTLLCRRIAANDAPSSFWCVHATDTSSLTAHYPLLFVTVRLYRVCCSAVCGFFIQLRCVDHVKHLMEAHHVLNYWLASCCRITALWWSPARQVLFFTSGPTWRRMCWSYSGVIQ